jgi:hypothetical protein
VWRDTFARVVLRVRRIDGAQASDHTLDQPQSCKGLSERDTGKNPKKLFLPRCGLHASFDQSTYK